MEKCYQVSENPNYTKTPISELITYTETRKRIEKNISEFVGNCYGNRDLLEDITAEDHAEFFQGFFENRQTKILIQQIAKSNQDRISVLKLIDNNPY